MTTIKPYHLLKMITHLWIDYLALKKLHTKLLDMSKQAIM